MGEVRKGPLVPENRWMTGDAVRTQFWMRALGWQGKRSEECLVSLVCLPTGVPRALKKQRKLAQRNASPN